MLLRDLDLEDLKQGAFRKEFPEFYALRECIEHFQPWHFHESVFDHTVSVLEALQTIFKRDNIRLRGYLAENPFCHYTKKDLLYLMGIFHDSAKPDTIIVNEQGFTRCPEHEKRGREKTRPILERFDLQSEEKEHVLLMIGLHGEFCYIQHRENPDNDYKLLQEQFPDIYLDMLFFELADINALRVADDGKQLQQEMINFYGGKVREYFK